MRHITHDFTLDTDERGQHQAGCSCGWESPLFHYGDYSVELALEEYDEHVRGLAD